MLTEKMVIFKNVLGAPGWLSWLSVQLCSGHDLVVHEFKPHIRLAAVSAEPASDPLSPSLCPSPTCILSKKKTLKNFCKECVTYYIYNVRFN